MRAVFAHFRRTPAGLPAKQKRTLILIESTCVCSIGVARLELAASCSQSRRATNCATPRHPAAQLHRRNIVYRFLRGSSIRNPQLTALHGPLFSAGRSGSRHFLWQLGAGLVQLTKSGCKNYTEYKICCTLVARWPERCYHNTISPGSVVRRGDGKANDSKKEGHGVSDDDTGML